MPVVVTAMNKNRVEMPLSRPDVPSSTTEQLKTEALFTGPNYKEGFLLAQRFRITKQLGSGAQGLVFSAKDELLDTDVALKIIEGSVTDPAQVTVLRNEVNIARQLQHPNIIRVHDVFCDDDTAFFTMEYVTGEPLYQRLQSNVSRNDFNLWKHQLLDAIAACQSIDIKHGDIKPDNILVDEDNNLRLIDFGIGQSVDMFTQTSGHHHYTAPEVLQTGKSNEQSDLFSAGKVLEDVFAQVDRNGGLLGFIWRGQQKNVLKKLTARNPKNRPALHTLLKESSTFTYSAFALATTGVVMLAVIAFYVVSTASKKLPTDLASGHPLQMIVLPHPDFPLLDTISELLRYPLSTHPDIALVPKDETANVIKNLALNPAQNDTQRVDFAALLGADTVLLLDATPTSSESYLLHASVLRMPANTAAFTTSATVNAATLTKDLAAFANTLVSNLFDALATKRELPDLRYLSALDTAWQKGEMPSVANTAEAVTTATPDYPGGWVALANIALDRGDAASAKKALDTLMQLPQLGEYWRLQGELIRAQIYDDLSLAQQAINALTNAYPNRPELLAMRADIHQWAGNDTDAMADYTEALTLRPNDGQLWFELARLQILNGDIETATNDTLTQALVAFRKVNNKLGESLVLNGFGIAHMRMAENATATKYFNDALTLRSADSQPSERAKTLANLALSTSMMGDYEVAEQALKEALSLLQNLGDIEQEAHVHDSLGFLYEEQGLYQEALAQYKRGLDLRVQLGDKILQPESMSNVAYMHFLIGDLSLAEIYWQQSKTLFERNGDNSHLLRTYQNLAQLSLVKGDNRRAQQYLTSVDKSLTDENNQERMYNHLLYSFLNFANSNVLQAITHINDAERLAKDNNDIRAFIEVNLWKGEVCLKIADWECLAQVLEQVGGDISNNSHEQYAVYQWLDMSLQHHTQSPVDDNSQVNNALIDTTNIPTITEIKILLDMQLRFNLDIDSEAMKKSTALMKPSLYQPYLDLLYIKAQAGDERSLKTLEQQVTLHDAYWRNHIYYSIIPNSEERQSQLTTQWLNQLTETQAKNYRTAYIE
ncbi:protein kinase domain-containing protein [Alteromonas genovensis]|uniref:protein kinase domain-containing protein n=1 Tax=Alteromonas genovensis TaxID=471225 RepID=UPI002FE27D75